MFFDWISQFVYDVFLQVHVAIDKVTKILQL